MRTKMTCALATQDAVPLAAASLGFCSPTRTAGGRADCTRWH